MLTYVDEEEGFPGNLSTRLTYTVTDDDALRIDYEAVTDRPTPVNPHDSYFHLAGPSSGTVLVG